ncbi:helix-turn-helix domain-containing protein [Agrilactobacillus fermenti]|uniref:helix-turn-helix domain-containing protein n=1 Tax=Agrilactobacillus fermenti TaxID=2586909 RepID=UPI001E59682F|nr:helix-turn-helix domain-containing protein [Agrilactobacillus fermenti]MCD2257527.1 helix-turn-helix domain-containing protein [Agrilactobacillus fermenti]
MRKVDDLFLSFSEMEKYNLFLSILEMKQKEVSPEQLIGCFQQHGQKITDINIKQVAELLGRSYGSVYNTYMGLISDLNNLLGTENANLEELFSVEAGAYYAFLTAQSYPYRFIDAIVQDKETSFKEFYANLGSSKATVLRHLKSMRAFLKDRGIRMTYEPMGFVGQSELAIRIAITSLYWRACGAYRWPFSDAARVEALEAVDEVRHSFDISSFSTNVNTLLSIFMVVSFQRMKHHYLIDFNATQNILHYAYPNLVREFAETRTDHLQDLSDAELMNETGGLFLVYNLVPVYSETNKVMVENFLQKLTYYNEDISEFVADFLNSLPLDEHDALSKTSVDIKVIKANLMAILIGVLAFNNSNMFLFNTDDQNVLDQTGIETTPLYRSLSNTFAHLAMDQKYSKFKPYFRQILPAFYGVLQPVLTLYKSKNMVNVYIQLRPSFFENSRLEQMIKTLAFVKILNTSDDLQNTDLVVASDHVSLPDDLPESAAVMIWPRSPSSDVYGRLYGILRELQLQKEANY